MEGYATKAIGGQLGGGLNRVEATRDPGDLQNINGRLQRAVSELLSNNERLSDIIARVYGGGLGGEKDAARPQAAGIIGSLNRQCEDIDEALARNRGLIDRLNAIA
jgi:hypothetical protein